MGSYMETLAFMRNGDLLLRPRLEMTTVLRWMETIPRTGLLLMVRISPLAILLLFLISVSRRRPNLSSPSAAVQQETVRLQPVCSKLSVLQCFPYSVPWFAYYVRFPAWVPNGCFSVDVAL